MLTCQQTLQPTIRTFGGEGGDNNDDSLEGALRYSSNESAWECVFSKDGQWLAVAYGAPHPSVRMYRCLAEQWHWHATLTLHERTVRSVAFAPLPTNNPYVVLASASFDGSVGLWEYNNDENHQKIMNTKDTNDDDAGWECTAQLEGHDNEVKCVEWNANATLLATCGRDKTVWIWECRLPGTMGADLHANSEFECLAVLQGHEGDVKTVRFAPSHGEWGDFEEILLSASYDNTIRCWAEDAGDWYCAATIQDAHASTIWELAVAPSGTRLVSASDDASLAIFKMVPRDLTKKTKQDREAQWKCVGTLCDAHDGTVYSISYAPARAGHGRMVSAGADGKLQVYREAPGSMSDQPLFSLETSIDAGQGELNCVCWHPFDGSLLATAGDTGQVKIWKYST